MALPHPHPHPPVDPVALAEAGSALMTAAKALGRDELAVAATIEPDGLIVAVDATSTAAPTSLSLAPGQKRLSAADVLHWESDHELLALCRMHTAVCIFARARAAALVEPDDWPAFRDRFYDDAEGARQALAF